MLKLRLACFYIFADAPNRTFNRAASFSGVLRARALASVIRGATLSASHSISSRARETLKKKTRILKISSLLSETISACQDPLDSFGNSPRGLDLQRKILWNSESSSLSDSRLSCSCNHRILGKPGINVTTGRTACDGSVIATG